MGSSLDWMKPKTIKLVSVAYCLFPAAFEKDRLNIDKKGTPSTLGKYLGHIK
jgi:hypothetical protein